jgi:hypothetical protein
MRERDFPYRIRPDLPLYYRLTDREKQRAYLESETWGLVSFPRGEVAINEALLLVENEDLFAMSCVDEIRQRLGRVSDLTVGICGDLANNPYANALVHELCKYPVRRLCFFYNEKGKLPVTEQKKIPDNGSIIVLDSILTAPEKLSGILHALYLFPGAKELFTQEIWENFLRNARKGLMVVNFSGTELKLLDKA